MKKDRDETKEQLLEELGKLRQKLRKLEAAETGRKQTEQILKESEEKYKLLVETSTDMIFTVDLKGNFLFVNKAFKKILGYSRADIKNINGFALVHPEDLPEVIKQFGGLVEGKKVDNMEYRYKAKKGSYIHILNNASPIFDSEGNVIAAFGIARNISQRKKMEEELQRAHDELERRVEKRTAELVSINKKLEKEIEKRKRTEQALRESEEKYRSIFESFHDVYYRTDREGRITIISPSVYSQAGYDPKEMIGKPVTDFYLDPADREAFLQELKKSGVINDYELKLKAKNGQKIDVSVSSRIIVRKKGKPEGVEGILRNITDRKKMEYELQENEKKFRTLIEQSLQAIVIFQDFRIVFANKALEKITGYTISELLSLSPEKVNEMLHPEDQSTVWERLKERLAGKSPPQHYEFRIVRKDKSVSWLEMYASLINYKSKPAIQAALIDITDRKKAETGLKESEEKYREIVELAPDGVLTINLKGVITSCNTAFSNLADISKDNIVGKHFTKLPRVRPRDIPKYIKMFNTLIKKEVPKPLEIEWHRKDGTTRWGEFLVSLMKMGRKTTGIQVIARDITERKRAEETLRESEENYRQLADSIADVFFEMDKDLRYTYWNKASENLTDISAKNALGKSFYELFPDVRGTKVDKFYLKALKTNKSISFVNEYQLNDRNYFFEITAYPSKRGLSVFVKDITERKKAEEQLKESEERYKDLVEKADIAILIDDKDGNLKYFNEKLLDLFGYSVEEMRKMPIRSIVHPDDVDRVMKYHQGRLQGKKVPSRYEFKGIRKDGSVIYLEVDAVKQKEGKKIIGSRSYIWDITKRKKAERELQKSMELFQKTFISQQDAIFLLDTNQPPLIIDCNPAAMKIFGYSRLEMLGRSSAFLHVNQTMLKKFQAQLYPVIEKSGFLFLPEFKMKRKNGTVFPSEHSVIPLKNEQGKRIGWVSVIRDITERKRAEEVLKESEEKFRNLAEQSPNMIFIHRKGQVVYANKKCEEMMGYKREEFYSPDFDFMTLIAPESKHLIRASFTKHKKGQDIPPCEYILVTKDGQRIEGILTSNLINYEGERAILGIVTDITEHKIAEEKYRSLYSAMNEGVCLHEIIYDDKGKAVDYRFTDINPAYGSITGLKKENVVRKKASQVYKTANPPFLNIFAKVAETGEPASIETYFPPLKKYFIISAFSPEKGKFATVFTDITERYNTERELIEAKDQAETSLKKLKRVQSQLIQSARLAALGKLSAGIAHEINNPLSIISGHTQILQMEKTPGRTELKQTLETIRKQVDRASSITDQLLQFSKRIKPRLKQSDVKEVLKDTLVLLKQQLAQDNIKIVKQLSSKPVFIQADSLQLQQVFLNLIVNASHAMPNGGTLTVNTMVKDANLEINFTDTGCGIPEEHFSKLFEPFFTTKENGTGLGLSIAYGIIKAHKGNIEVKSKEGKGTTFTMILPYE